MPTYAMLDTGANVAGISRDLCGAINAPTKTIVVKLGTFDKTTTSLREVASFTVSNLNRTFFLHVNNALIGNMLSTEREQPPTAKEMAKIPHFAGLVFNELEDKTIGLLLDARYAHTFLTGDVRSGSADDLIAISTSFGWSVIGRGNAYNVVNNDIDSMDVDVDRISDWIRRMFRSDFIDQSGFPQEHLHMSVYDELSLKQLEETFRRDEQTGRYICGIPWKEGRSAAADKMKTVNTYRSALAQHHKFGEKLQKNPEHLEGCFKQMRSTIEQGHARILENLDAPEGSPVAYLPTMLVLNPHKPGKFRLVQNPKSVTAGVSVNGQIHNGPDFTSKLIMVFMQFRRHRYTMTADIKEFFFQIGMDERDRSMFRFFWWSDEQMQDVIVLEANVHMFGLASSPTVAAYTLKRIGKDAVGRYPENVSTTLDRKFYVDDLMTSVPTIEESRQLKADLKAVLAEAGMNLCKFRSNVPELDDTIQVTPPDTQPEVAGRGDADRINAGLHYDDNQRNPTSGPGQQPIASSTPAVPSTNWSEDAAIAEIDAILGNDGEKLSSNELYERMSSNWEEIALKEILHDLPDRALGVSIDYVHDVIGVFVGTLHLKVVVTKLDLCSVTMAVYDPTGMFAPFVLFARRFLQDCNEQCKGWKDKVPEEILVPFNKWQKSIPLLRDITIPRWTNPLGFDDCVSELIAFSDSSCYGYGCVIYVKRYLQGGGDASIAFLMGKSHTVPKNMSYRPTEDAIPHGDSIPRLELMAMKVATRAMDAILRESGEKFDDFYLFSDSTTNINWIGNFDKRLPTYENGCVRYVRARMQEINEHKLVPIKLRHCPTNDNPADLSSKGVSARDKKRWEFYHNGPKWLKLPVSEWPPARPQKAGNTAPEAEVDVACIDAEMDALDEMGYASPFELLYLNATNTDDDLEIGYHEEAPLFLQATEKLELWSRKLRRIMVVRKIATFWREKTKRKLERVVAGSTRAASKAAEQLTMTFLPEDKEAAEKLLVRAIQGVHFHKEMVWLARQNIFKPNALNGLRTKDSPLRTLSPFIDDDNIMRSGGRIGKAHYMPYDTRYPVILPGYRVEEIRALIRYYHSRISFKDMHLPIKSTHNLLREKYYLLGGMTSVQNVIRRCAVCQRLAKPPESQPEGDLPEERLEIVAPFTNAGLDVFGPFHLKHTGRGTKKQFVLMVCCMVTRAVALFMLRDMTTSSVINALMEVKYWYPGLRKIFSDQGSNFKGADREIKEAIKAWDKNKLTNDLAMKGLEWHFGPAACGSAGGAWERLIGLCKRLIRSVIGTRNVDEHDFKALLTGAAGIMNKRPIVQASADMETLVLTPQHFLHPYLFSNSNTSIVPFDADRPERLRHGWKATNTLLDDFWTRYKKDYVTSLIKRRKSSPTEPIKVGDVVLIVDDGEPREYWRCATVMDILNDDKQHPRRFSLRDARGTVYDRHVTGVVKLELSP